MKIRRRKPGGYGPLSLRHLSASDRRALIDRLCGGSNVRATASVDACGRATDRGDRHALGDDRLHGSDHLPGRGGSEH